MAARSCSEKLAKWLGSSVEENALMVFFMDGCPACIQASDNVVEAAKILDGKGLRLIAYDLRRNPKPANVRFAPTIVAVDCTEEWHPLPTDPTSGREDRSADAIVRLAAGHLSPGPIQGGHRATTLAQEVFSLLHFAGGGKTGRQRREEEPARYEEAEIVEEAKEYQRNRRKAAELTAKLRFAVERARAEGATKEEIRKLFGDSEMAEQFLPPDEIPKEEVARLTEVGRQKLLEEVANSTPAEARSAATSMEAVLALRSAVDAQIAHQTKLLADPVQARKAEQRLAELNELSFLAAPRTREEAELLGALVRSLASGKSESVKDLHAAIVRYRRANLKALPLDEIAAVDAERIDLTEAAAEALAASKMLDEPRKKAEAAAVEALNARVRGMLSGQAEAPAPAPASASAAPAVAGLAEAAQAILETPVPRVGKETALMAAQDILKHFGASDE